MRFLATILTLFAFVGGFAQTKEKVLDRVIAVVGKNVVLHSDLEAQYNQYLNTGLPVTDDTRCLIIQDLLYQKLLLNQAQIDSLEISDQQVEAEMDRRLRYFIQQIGSERALEEYYKKSIIEIKEEFRGLIKEQLQIQQMQGQISSGLSVTPREVKEYYNSIPKDSLPFIDSEVEVAHLVIYAALSEAAKKKAKDKINGLRERILNGEDFATLAILYSEDPGSASKGGELGYMGRAELVPEFAAVAFKLKNDQVSKIVETKFGYHIMQLIQRKGEKVNVRHILVRPKFDGTGMEEAQHKIDSARNLIAIDSLSFEEAAQKFSEDEATANSGGNMISFQTGETRMTVDELNKELFFVIDKMKVGEISKPIAYESLDGKNGLRIVLLKMRTEPHRANLNDDYQRLSQVALQIKQQKAMDEWVTDKIRTTFIEVKDGFEECEFDQDWRKTKNKIK